MGTTRGLVRLGVILVTAAGIVAGSAAQDGGGKKGAAKGPVLFSRDVFPIIQKSCLPCHAEEQFNPSELSLDSYELLMAGGKHGAAVVPGKGKESMFVKKLGPNPPFGDRMPLDPKKKGKPSSRALSEEEIRIIEAWIDEGAKKN